MKARASIFSPTDFSTLEHHKWTATDSVVGGIGNVKQISASWDLVALLAQASKAKHCYITTKVVVIQ